MIASEAGVYYVHRGGEPASKVEPTEREQSVETEQEGAVDKKENDRQGEGRREE